jgi:hypothetical protein
MRLSQNFSFWESNPDFIRGEGLILKNPLARGSFRAFQKGY